MRRLSLLLLILLLDLPRLSAQDLTVSMLADRNTAFVNEQVLLTLTVKMVQKAFSLTGDQPEVTGVEVLSMHKSESIVVENSIAYRVITRVFALFANKAATVTIPALRYQAVLPVPKDRTDGAAGNPMISAESRPLQLNIKPSLSAGTGRIWFAAESVEIVSAWSKPDDTTRAGEPVTHTLTVNVQGQHAAAIPEIQLKVDGEARLYPQAPVLVSGKSSTGLVGSRKQLTSVIAPVAGSYRFPELAIDWWDINTRQWRVSRIAAQELSFLEGLVNRSSLDSVAWLKERFRYRLSLAVMCLVTLSLIIFNLLAWHRTRQAHMSVNRVKNKVLTERRAWRLVKRSLGSTGSGESGYIRARADVIAWAQVRWPERNISRLEQLAAMDPECSKMILSLDDIAFGQRVQFDSRAFITAVKRLRASTDQPDSTMQELYPGQ
ncbi:hypothetical protein AB833_19860 [Chromatiales bacterium (ex Bugula neritina AB1)]|nr:hypothetical protein AB833_19860 [Chromatiales bacterium (ex Bugula neritina AB1)]